MIRINNIIEKLIGKLRVVQLKLQGATVRGLLGLRYGVDIPRLQSKILFGKFTNLDRGVSIVLTTTAEKKVSRYLLELGSKVYINRNTSIDATVSIKIGDQVMIGPNCYITDHDHSFQKYPAEAPKGELPLDGIPTIIENNVWLGSNVVVLKGVTIGQNSVIGAGSIVTKSIPANVVAVGNPCKVIRKLE